jgi:hypothetical protein
MDSIAFAWRFLLHFMVVACLFACFFFVLLRVTYLPTQMACATFAAKNAVWERVCMTRDVWRAHVFRFPARSSTYRICVTVLAQAQTSGRRYVIVDNYNTDMNAAGWSVRGGSVLPFLRAHAPPSCQRFPFSLQDVAHNHVIW